MKKLLLLSVLILFSCSKEASEPEIIRYTLTVTANPPEGGLVNPQTGTYNAGQSVNIIASANDFFTFKDWTGNWNGSDPEFTITMDSNKNITANFSIVDSDLDGVREDLDLCPNSSGEVDSNGCSEGQRDDDSDGVINSVDVCPNTNSGSSVDGAGCAIYQRDTDNDGVTDDIDQDNSTRSGAPVDEYGIMLNPIYLDENGVTIKSNEWGIIGDTGEINGKVYSIVNKSQLESLISSAADLTNIVTTYITDMRNLFSNNTQ